MLSKNLQYYRVFQLDDKEIYNIVSSNNTVRDVVETIRESIPEVEVKLVESEIMNQLSYQVCSDRIKHKGLSLYDNIEKGIIETINLLKNSYL